MHAGKRKGDGVGDKIVINQQEIISEDVVLHSSIFFLDKEGDAVLLLYACPFGHICNFLDACRKYLEETCIWVDSNTTTLGILSSQVEIGVGFLLIFSLFSWQRNIIQTFMYWQLLKLMYHAPASAGYHRGAWSRIGQTVNPFIQRYAPFWNSPISAIQRWWFR